MASKKLITNSDGTVSYKITVSMGRDTKGKQILKYATFRPDPQKSERQNKQALERFIVEFEDKCKSGQIVSERITLQAFAERWLDVYVSKLEKTTQSNYRTYLETTILPRIGYYKLADIRPSTIQTFLDSLRKETYDYGNRKGTYSESAVQTAKKILSSMLSYAVADNIIPTNPVKSTLHNYQKVEKKEAVKCFDIQQAITFLDFIEKPVQMIVPEHYVNRNGKRVRIKEYCLGEYIVPLKYRAAFVLTIFSGVRKEELLGLKWKDIDFDNHSIEVNEAVVYLKDEGYIVKKPKSKVSRGILKLPPTVRIRRINFAI